MNEDGICSKTDMLTLLKYLKKIGRQVFDADFLLEVGIMILMLIIPDFRTREFLTIWLMPAFTETIPKHLRSTAFSCRMSLIFSNFIR